VGEGTEPPAALRGPGPDSDAPMNECPPQRGIHYYYGIVTYLRPLLIEKARLIRGDPDFPIDGTIFGDVSALVITGYVRPVCEGECAAMNWSASPCVSTWSADYVSSVVLEASTELPGLSKWVRRISTFPTPLSMPEECFGGLYASLGSGWTGLLVALGGGSALATHPPNLSMVPLTTSPVLVLVLLSPASGLIGGGAWDIETRRFGDTLTHYLAWVTGTCMQRVAEPRLEFLTDVMYRVGASVNEIVRGTVRACTSVVAWDKSVGGRPLLAPASTSSCGGVGPWSEAWLRPP